MNDVVVPFKKPVTTTKEDEVEWLHNTAKCLTCKHEWAASAPVGTVWLVCPACDFGTGRFIGSVRIEGDHWHCKCGNDLFRITPTKTYCPCCGVLCVFK